MLFGIGTDLVRIARMERALARHGERLARRLLSPEELEDYRRQRRPARFLARRFAAKEAVAKALGTGFRGVAPRDLGVGHDALGRPLLRPGPRAARLFAELGVGEGHLSIADEEEYALAHAVLLRAPPPGGAG
ncbi:MAG: holo-ACP synthase [Gammaproteobacteria bacterium]|nr:MAG: holo-ACP synthase [Gammaproteobacteria bacterium]